MLRDSSLEAIVVALFIVIVVDVVIFVYLAACFLIFLFGSCSGNASHAIQRPFSEPRWRGVAIWHEAGGAIPCLDGNGNQSSIQTRYAIRSRQY